MHLTLPLVLASRSPRRRELMEQAGLSFEAIPSTIREPDQALSHVPPAQQAEALAYFKARQVAQTLQEPCLVLGADTLVAARGRVFQKAGNEAEARRMLAQLSGTKQQVITGVALIDTAAGQRDIRHAVTELTMRSMTDTQIDAYIETGAWRDKAGAYAIQEGGDAFVESMAGSLSNVVGLPVDDVLHMLEAYVRADACEPVELPAASSSSGD